MLELELDTYKALHKPDTKFTVARLITQPLIIFNLMSDFGACCIILFKSTTINDFSRR